MARSKKYPNSLLFEELEPRLLFSADMGEALAVTAVEQDYVEEPVVIANLDSEAEVSNVAVDQPKEDFLAADSVHTDNAATGEEINEQDASSQSTDATILKVVDEQAVDVGTSTVFGSRTASSEESKETESAETTITSELLFVNDNVQDVDQMVANILQVGDVSRSIKVVILDGEQDGIEQVSNILADHSNLAAVHFITHGADGQINLGNSWLNSTTLQQNSVAVAGWGNALNEKGDLLFYGCNIAAGSDGQILLDNISDLTGADVAASDDLTGSSEQSGDWDLEFESGVIETSLALTSETQQKFSGVLPADKLPPVISLSGTPVNYIENGPATVIDIDATATASDPDSTVFAKLTVDFTANGTANDRLAIRNQGTGAGEIGVNGSNVTYGNTTIGTFTGGTNGSTPLVITFNTSSTPTAIQALMRNVTYNNVSENPSTLARTVRFVLIDGGNNSSNTVSKTINVTASNDAPVNTVPGIQSTQPDTPLVFSLGNGNAITVTDPDAGVNQINVTLSVNNGLLSINNVTGTVSEINALLNGLTYTPTPGYTGTDTLTITTNDQGNTGGVAQQDVDTIQIDVLLANDAPFLNVLDGTPAFTEGGTAVALDTNVDVSDAELDALNGGLGNYAGASLTLVRNGGASADDVLSFNDGNGITLSGGNLIKNAQIIASFDTTTTPGELVVSFTDAGGEIPTSADVDNILRQITYANSSDTPPASVQINWIFDDGNTGAQGTGGALTTTGSTTVNITAVNDAPVNTVPGSQTTPQDTPLVLSSDTGNAISVTDPDASTGELEVTLSVSNGTLRLSPVAPLGNETLVNSTTADSQGLADLAVAPDGSYVVVWQSYNQDGGDMGIYLQRFAADGKALGGETLVNFTTANWQQNPAIAMDSSGNFVVVWDSYPGQDGSWYGVYGQRFKASGETVGGEFLVNTTTADYQRAPDVAMAAGGGFVVAWEGGGTGDTYGVFVQRFDAAGVKQGSETLINTSTTGQQKQASIAIDGSGNYVVAWYNENDQQVYARRYHATGTSDEFVVNTTSAGNQWYPSVGMNATGQFVVAWRDEVTKNIFAQRYDATGAAQGDEFQVNLDIDSESDPQVAVYGDGGFAISFTRTVGTNSDVYVRRYDSNGNMVGSEIQVNATTTFIQTNDSIAILPNGDFLVAWRGYSPWDSSGILTRRLGDSVSMLSFSAGDGVDDATMTFTGTTADINTALDGLTYTPTASYTGTANLQIHTSDLGQTGTGGTMTDDDTVDITVTSVETSFIWLSTGADVPSPSGAPGLDSWSKQTVIELGNPNLAMEPGTSNGTFSVAVDFENFASVSGDVDAIHVMGRSMTVNGVALQTGDVLFSTTINLPYTSVNSVSPNPGDVYVFQPTTPGDYSSGTFTLVIDADVMGVGGITAFSLVESNVTVGSHALEAGDFLYVAGDQDIRFYDKSASNDFLLVDGWGTNFYGDFGGIDLVEQTTLIGDTTVTAGRIVATTLDNQAQMGATGSTRVDVVQQDLIVLNVNPSNTTATVELLMQGIDFGFDATKDWDGLSLVPVVSGNTAPIITMPGAPLNYTENAAATILDSTATASDADSPNFDTGTLTIDYTANGTANDRLAIRNQGTGVGQIGVSGANVTYNFGTGAVTIGTWTGGVGTTPLVITFNSSATPEAAQALVRNITYANVSDNPSTSARTVRFVLTDGDGGTSAAVTQTINITTAPWGITGFVYEDVDGDGDILDDGTIVDSVFVHLYRDGGDGTPDGVDDVYITAEATDGAGEYMFGDLSDGTYWVVVDSKWVKPSGGVGALAADDVWAEQTYGSSGSVTQSGAFYAYSLVDNSVYGGKRSEVSDDAGSLAGAEHVNRVVVSGATVNDVDFGFSFNMITNTRDGGDDDLTADRTQQGTLRQFLQNSNAIITEQSSQFVIPTSDANYDAATNSYHIAVSGSTLPYLAGGAIVIDGTTQNGYDGTPSIDIDGALLAGADQYGFRTDGGPVTIRGLVIRNFTGMAINFEDGGSHTIQGNYIGTDVTGTLAQSNQIGIVLSGGTDSSLVGGTNPGDGNLIAFNTTDGVQLTGGVGDVAILGNSFYSNGGLSINLVGGIEDSFGVTANDVDDTDFGTNGLQNFPVLTTATVNGSNQATVAGTLNSTPSTTFRIEFFANTAADGSGHGEGRWYLGSALVTTDSNGDASFSETLLPVYENDYITATATVDLGSDQYGSTSEFSAHIQATAPSNVVPVLATSIGTTAYTEQATAIAIDSAIDSGLTLTDGDGNSGDNSSAEFTAEVRITNNFEGNDLLGFTDTVNIRHNLVDNTMTLYVVDGQTATVAEFEAALRSVTFYNGSDNPSTLDRTVSISFYDGMDNSNTATKTISVAAVNDAPTVTITGSALAYTENATATVIDAGLTISDPDSVNLTGAIVQITGNFTAGQDVLAFTNQPGITGSWNAATGVLTLSGTTTVANYQTALRSVTYVNTSDNPSTTTRTVSFVVNDGTANSSAGTRNISVSALNDAPTLSNGATVILTGTDENTTSSGTTIDSLLTSASWADVDAAALKGIAITGKTGNGTWQYSTNGVSWTAFGAVSASNALLLTSTSQVRYVPDNANGETATFGFVAWDQTTGTTSINGTPSYANPGAGGGTTAYSSQSATTSITVTSLNDAPGMSGVSLGSINEDLTKTWLVSTFVSASWDVDTDALKGLAIVGADNSNGTWQYTLNDTDWLAIGSVSTTNALLLAADATSAFRFVPNANWNGTTGMLQYKAWDQTSGTAGTYVDVSVSGGTTAFSGTSGWSFKVTAINDAPTALTTSISLGAVDEDTTDPAGATVSTLFGAAFSDAADQVSGGSSANNFAGAAIVANVANATTEGVWQWYNGTSWTSISTSVSTTNALTLAPTTLIRFLPNSDYNGTPGTLTVRLVDDSAGAVTNGATVNVGTGGGTSKYSSADNAVTLITSVTPVNDLPVADNDAYTIDEDTPLAEPADGVLLTDADVDGDSISAVLVSDPSHAASFTLNADGSFSYTPTANWNGTDSFTYKANDGTADGNVATVTITVNPVNDAPVLVGISPTLTEINEGDTDNSGNTVAEIIASAGGDPITDPDSGAVEGIAISWADNSNGTWEYSTNGGTTWTAIGTVSDSAALLLTDDAANRIRFVPDKNFNGIAQFSYRAWDRSDDKANAATGNVSINGGTTAFSSGMATATLTVQSVEFILYMSSSGDVSASGAPGLESWDNAETIALSDPNISFEPGTSDGTLYRFFDLRDFWDGSGVSPQIDAMHYVSEEITISRKTDGDLVLKRGDILFGINTNSVKLTGSDNNTITTTKTSLYLFRPDTVGDCSSGIFLTVLNDFSINEVEGISLVEIDTQIGDTLVTAGTFLYNAGNNQNILHYDPTTDTTSTLISAEDIGMGNASAKVTGIDLIETGINLGTLRLATGSILVTLDGNDTLVGNNNISVTSNDIFYLDVTTTSMGVTATTSANAHLLIQGADMGLDTADERITGLTLDIIFGSENEDPDISLPGSSLTYTENQPPVVLDAEATVSDPDSFDFAGGMLRVDFTANGTADDRLAIRNEGTGAGQVGVIGINVTYGGVSVATYTGGTGTNPLVITFNSSATVATVQSILRNITYANVSDDPATDPRIVRFVVTDGDGGTSNVEYKTVNVIAVNDAPVVAANTGMTVDEGAIGSSITTAMLNEGDPDDAGSGLIYTLTTLTAHGTLRLNSTALGLGDTFTQADIDTGFFLTYDHDDSENFSDSFGFTLTDGGEDGAAPLTGQTFAIVITPVNDNDPVANNDSITVDEGGTVATLNGGATSVLANDSDVDLPNDTLTVSVETGPTHGNLTLNSDGTFSYIHDGSENFTDAFTYIVTDANGGTTATGTVNITINPVNDAPVATADSFSGDEDTTITGTVLINDSDAENDDLTVNTTPVSAPAHGDLTLNADGSFTYTPAANFNGEDTFTYEVSDGNGGTSQALVTITVAAVNDIPVISGTFTGAVTEGNVGDAAVTASGTIAISDVDVEDAPFFADVASTAGANGYGSFVLSAGTWTYTLDQSAVQDLDADDSVTDTITYTASDSSTQQITVTITGTNDAAVISGTTTGTVTEDGPLTTTGTLIISDIDTTDPTSFVDVAATAGDNGYGTFALTAGTWTYTLDNTDPAVQALDVLETLTDTFTFTAPDGVTQLVTVTINGAEDAPVFDSSPVLTATEDVAYSYSITTSDTDIEALTITATTLPAWLTLNDNGNGTATLIGTPTNSAVGANAVVLEVSDGVLNTTQSFTITVGNTNDPAVIGGVDTGAVQEDVAVAADTISTSGLLTISDDDSGEASFQAATINGSYGRLVLQTDGNWTYSADNTRAALQALDSGEFLTDTMTVAAFDGTTHNVVITLNGTDDAAVISGTTTGTVTEDGPLTTTGTLIISDIDTTDPTSFVDVAATAGDNGYGTFALTAGTWTYTLDNSHPAGNGHH